MAFSQTTLIQRVRDLIQDAPWRTTFTGNINSSTATVPVPDGTRWDEAALLEFQDNGEVVWVSSVSSNNLTTIRGQHGSTAAAHDGSVTAIVLVRDPRFLYNRIKDSIELTIQSMWPYAYKKTTITKTYDSTKTWYDLASDYMALISVTQVDSSVSPSRLYVYGSKGSRLPIVVKRQVPTSFAASGTAIAFPSGFASQSASYPVQIDYAAKLTTTTGSGNYSDLDDGILAETIAYGAAARLVMVSDVPRSTNQDTQMGDGSVPPLARTRVGRDLFEMFKEKRLQYWRELQRTMPLIPEAPGPMASSRTGVPYFSNPPF